MILDLIVSKNIERRQLNAGQRVFVGMEYQRHYDAAIKAEENRRKLESPSNQYTTQSSATTQELGESHYRESPRHDRESTAKTGRTVGASRESMRQGNTVARDAPDLGEKVRNGELALESSLWPLCAPQTRESPGGHHPPVRGSGRRCVAVSAAQSPPSSSSKWNSSSCSSRNTSHSSHTFPTGQ